jgi:type VI secretion system protein VasD
MLGPGEGSMLCRGRASEGSSVHGFIDSLIDRPMDLPIHRLARKFCMRSFSTITAFLVALVSVAALPGCVSSAPKPEVKEPVRLELKVSALPGVNPDDQGRAEPIAVRIYALKNANAFNEADFFTLQNRDKTVLADDLLKRDEFVLRPGEHRTIVGPFDPSATTIGVLAAYRDLPNSVWRAVYSMPATQETAWYRFSKPKLRLAIDLEANAIEITEVKR